MAIRSRASIRINGVKYDTIAGSTEVTLSGIERTRVMNDSGTSGGSTEVPKAGMIKTEIAAVDGLAIKDFDLTNATVVVEFEGGEGAFVGRGSDFRTPSGWKSGEGKYVIEYECTTVEEVA